MIGDYDAPQVTDVLGLAFMERLEPEENDPPEEPFIVIHANDPNPATHRILMVEGDNWLNIRGVLKTPWHGGEILTWMFNSDVKVARNFWKPSIDILDAAVREGFPRFTLLHMARRIAGDDKAKAQQIELEVVPRSTLERRSAKKKLSPEESERTERIARIFVQATRALGTEGEAREFMTSRHPLLEMRTPIETARTDLGARKVEQILSSMEYGLPL